MKINLDEDISTSQFFDISDVYILNFITFFLSLFNSVYCSVLTLFFFPTRCLLLLAQFLGSF